MMRKIYLLLCLLVLQNVQAQNVNNQTDDNDAAEDSVRPAKNKPEIFTKGSFDISVNGQINATARLVKINLGEPRKFNLPAALFVGVTTRAIGNYQVNDELLQNFINPYSGLLSFCIDDERRFRKRPKNITGFSVLYQCGIKMLNGYDSLSKKYAPFNCQFGNFGLGFLTQAWERNMDFSTRKGFLWLHSKLHFTQLPQAQVQKIANKAFASRLMAFSILAGIDIDKSINFKFSYYKYLINPIIEKVQPLVQATVNYNFNK